MRTTIGALGALLLAAGVLFAGSGLQGSLLALRANSEGFSLTVIGLLMSLYSAGFVVGCRLTPRLVKNVGHIRTFTALASVASAVALAHVLVIDSWVWMALRGVSGFCFAGLMMVVESWINEKATNANRGRVLSVYRIVDLGSLMIGQVLLSTADPGSFVLFAIVSILVSMSLVPVALSTASAPRPLQAGNLGLRRVFAISPLAAVGTLLVGFASSAFWAVGPVFVQNLGYEMRWIAIFMTTTILGGALAQAPLGAVSDIIDRRMLANIIALLAAASGGLLWLMSEVSVAWLLAGGALFGAFAMSLFGLFVAQANDHAQPDDFVGLNASLLLLYGLGSIIGPLLAGLTMNQLGTSALFAYTMCVHLMMAVYGFWRMTRRGAAKATDHDEIQANPNTSPVIFQLYAQASNIDQQPPKKLGSE